ncbi:hypothetical protein AB0Q95_05015 [Streptomyces sp. NPDC059900]|uniref:hypothetical protein n=1 Tax=Streptomyces sp. NPDC059900 TaxID=3155816 RepID=UPI00341A3EB1
MPVIQVTAPKDADYERDAARLKHLCGQVAAALGLPLSGVIAVLSDAVMTSSGHGIVTAWPLAVIHGSDRGHQSQALDAAAEALAEGWGVPRKEVWVEWAGFRPAGE